MHLCCNNNTLDILFITTRIFIDLINVLCQQDLLILTSKTFTPTLFFFRSLNDWPWRVHGRTMNHRQYIFYCLNTKKHDYIKKSYSGVLKSSKLLRVQILLAARKCWCLTVCISKSDNKVNKIQYEKWWAYFFRIQSSTSLVLM